MDRVRDAMVPEPRTLRGDSPAQEAGELLSRPEVRAVFVREGEKLVGVLSRSALQRRLAEDEPPPLDEDPGTVY